MDQKSVFCDNEHHHQIDDKNVTDQISIAKGKAERDLGNSHFDLACSSFVCGGLPTGGTFRQGALRHRSICG